MMKTQTVSPVPRAPPDDIDVQEDLRRSTDHEQSLNDFQMNRVLGDDEVRLAPDDEPDSDRLINAIPMETHTHTAFGHGDCPRPDTDPPGSAAMPIANPKETEAPPRR